MPFRFLSFRTAALAVPVVALAAVFGCPRSGDVWGDGPTPRVAVSFAPLYCFTVNVAGDDATVRSVLTSQGPHHFDPKLAEAKLIGSADLFLINGLGLEDRAAEKMLRASGNKTVRLIKLGDKLDAKLLLDGEHDHDHDHAGHDHSHDWPNDPHVWLGLDQAAAMVDAIRDELMVTDPQDAGHYELRARDYTDKLKKLKAEGQAQLAGKTERKFVTFHESLRYFASTFGLEVAAVIQKTAGKEPTAKELDALVKVCLDKKVRVIAVEPQYTTQTAANRLKEELELKGVKDVALVEIDPLETANESELNAGWYEARMRTNIDALAKALK
jgi:zinc transport system substrate-binding protein